MRGPSSFAHATAKGHGAGLARPRGGTHDTHTVPTALIPQALALATASGVSVYATVALLGLAARFGWVDQLPGALGGAASWWVIGVAGALYTVEFLATLVPGVASLWETVHAFIRPVAGAAVATATVWGESSPTVAVIAALLGGTLAFGSQATKLGARVAIDASPEPVSNGAANVAELGFVGAIAYLVWEHPWIALGIAVTTTIAIALVVRTVWRAARRALGTPGRSSRSR